MDTPTSVDAIEVSNVLANKLRPVYYVLVAITGGLVWGGTHIYDIGVYVTEQKAHERSQDQKTEEAEIHLKLHAAGDHPTHTKREDKRLKLMLEQHDNLRELILQSFPLKRRSKLREEFKVQRARERNILVGDD